MKLIFICSSLEPGRDGVGDYTKLLAGELIKYGHQAAVIALHDRYLQIGKEEGFQEHGEFKIDFLRVSAQLPWKKRLVWASEYILSHNPEWLSLQFVPFGFHDKGLPFGLDARLKKLGEGRKWHIMFHELWVGMDCESSIKYRVWGWLQKKIINYMLRILQPAKIHTQTLLYQYQLQKMGFKIRQLPLFSNIRSFTQPAANLRSNKHPSRFVLFGSIHHGAPVVEFVSELSEYSKRISKSVTLVFAGRNGPQSELWIKACRNAGLLVEVTGEQSSNHLSEIFLASQVGVVTTPVLLAEKSGAVAAMREHGLPVLCVARSWFPRGITMQQLPATIPVYRSGCLSQFLLAAPVERQASYSVLDVAVQLIEELEQQWPA